MENLVNFIWAWLAIWVSWIWVAIGQWILWKKSAEVMWKNKELSSFFLTITILGIALVESAAIYGLIVAFKILWTTWISMWASIWAWLAIWLAWFWAWVWEWKLIAWAIWAIDKSPHLKSKIMTFMVLFVALVESAAIYGLVISFKILWDIDFTSQAFIGMWLAVWVAWLWVSIWEWILAEKSMEMMSKQEKMSWYFLTVTILGIALVESAAIYGLIVAFKMFWTEWLSMAASIWAWLAIWLAWLWAWVWEWILVRGAIWAMWTSPHMKSKLMTFMVLFIALVESAAIYWLVISFKILWDIDFTSQAFIGMWLAVWLAWLWVSIWEWILSAKSVKMMVKQEKMIWFFLTVTILGIALVESAAIYWLVVAFDIFGKGLSLMASIGSWLSIWLSGLWAWFWEWVLVAWAMAAISRNPAIKWKLMTFMVLFVALVEVTAIYGLIVSFKISSWFDPSIDQLVYTWAWLAIWLAWLWVGIGRWYLSEESMEIMWKNPVIIGFMLTVSILWVALVESAAIYALVVSFKILWATWLSWLASVWAWFAIWFAWLWAWIWEGLLIKWAINWINVNPEEKWKTLAFMVLFVALVEVVAIYWLLIAFKVIG